MDANASMSTPNKEDQNEKNDRNADGISRIRRRRTLQENFLEIIQMKYLKPCVLSGLGAFLIIIALILRNEQKTWIEQERQSKTIPGTVVQNAAIGGAVGVTAGAATGAAIGGIGIAACGTGIGIPVGLVCIGLAAIMGTAGAAVGAATGETSKVVEELVPVTKTGPAYSTWIWVMLLIIGICLIIYAIHWARKIHILEKGEAVPEE